MGKHFETPNPHIQGKNMNTNMATKLSSLPCFEAFGVMFCQDFCSDICFACGGRGSLSRFCMMVRLKVPASWRWQQPTLGGEQEAPLSRKQYISGKSNMDDIERVSFTSIAAWWALLLACSVCWSILVHIVRPLLDILREVIVSGDSRSRFDQL